MKQLREHPVQKVLRPGGPADRGEFFRRTAEGAVEVGAGVLGLPPVPADFRGGPAREARALPVPGQKGLRRAAGKGWQQNPRRPSPAHHSLEKGSLQQRP